MNIHITWLTYVRTGPPRKKSRPGNLAALKPPLPHWYPVFFSMKIELLLRKHDVIKIRQTGNVLRVVQPTMLNAWCVPDS